MQQAMLTTKVDTMDHHALILKEKLSKIRIQLDSMRQNMPITNTNEMEHCAAMLSDRQIKSDIVCKNEHCTYDDTHISLVVYRILKDTVRRKRSVVITGLPERPDIDDITAFTELCEYYLPVKPTVGYGGCRRIGQETSAGPRRLLLRLNSETMAVELIRCAPLLRKSDDEYVARKIFINRDLSPSESKLAYEARKRRRDLKKINMLTLDQWPQVNT